MEIKSNDQVIEDLQESIVNAGGKFFRRAELESMSLGELLKMLEPNGIKITVWNMETLNDIFGAKEEKPLGGVVNDLGAPAKPWGGPVMLYADTQEGNPLTSYPESMEIKLENPTDIFDDEPRGLSPIYNNR